MRKCRLNFVTFVLAVIFPIQVACQERIGQFDQEALNPIDEAYIFTPPGFNRVGRLATADGDFSGRIQVIIRDATTGKPTFCRVNVVGSDGNFYQPPDDIYTPHNLNVAWPEGRGNRATKAPIRYFGKFFYSTGSFEANAPPGKTRIEVWKGFEYQPQIVSVDVAAGQKHKVEVSLRRSVPMESLDYWGGDPHLHFDRMTKEDDRLLLDLLEAEDILFAGNLAWNYDTNTYNGLMSALHNPQRALGERSIAGRGNYSVVSGQEYRSLVYGHMTFFLVDQLVLPGAEQQVNEWPVFGELARAVQKQGGFAFHAHGGYAQEIHADAVQGTVDAVELLQFGKYRGIQLEGWYHILNAGIRLSAFGASDFDPCRKMGDCRTYVHHAGRPTFRQWLQAIRDGQSFMTSGPVLLLEVGGRRPGKVIELAGDAPHQLNLRVRTRCEVAPITTFQVIVNGIVVRSTKIPAGDQQGKWFEHQQLLELDGPSWIAARVFSKSPTGSPDAEAHTNPVFVCVDGRSICCEQSLDWLMQQIEEQIAFHERREFNEQNRVIEYFKHSKALVQQLSLEKAVIIPATAAD